MLHPPGVQRRQRRRRPPDLRANTTIRTTIKHHLWETWGKDLSEYLDSIYGGGDRYCVILISEDYRRKPYTTLERRIALAHAMERADEYILPIVLDDAWVPGLPRTTAYMDLRTMALGDIAAALVWKVKGEHWEVRMPENSPSPGSAPCAAERSVSPKVDSHRFDAEARDQPRGHAAPDLPKRSWHTCAQPYRESSKNSRNRLIVTSYVRAVDTTIDRQFATPQVVDERLTIAGVHCHGYKPVYRSIRRINRSLGAIVTESFKNRADCCRRHASSITSDTAGAGRDG